MEALQFNSVVVKEDDLNKFLLEKSVSERIQIWRLVKIRKTDADTEIYLSHEVVISVMSSGIFSTSPVI